MHNYSVGDEIDGRYVLKREIARGGHGIVFEAEQKYTTRSVAIKVLLLEEQAKAQSRIRLLREARALTVARHPNIVGVLDAGVTEVGGPFLVMELLEGRALDGILATRRSLSPPDAAFLVAQIADGVAKLHRHGLVHRDIKPSNVFIRYSYNGEEAVTLLDFGATTHEALAERQRITRDNSLIGTPEYMSPEQLLGEKAPDQRMDVYALGVILYECLLGSVPYSGAYGEILLQVHSGKKTALHDQLPTLPPGLASILQRAMAFNLSERIPSAAQLAIELRKELESTQAVPGSLLGLNTGLASERRRRFTRAPYTTPVQMRTADGQRFSGKTQDLSTGGVLVFTEERNLVAERIEVLEISLPRGGAPMDLQVDGKWSKEARNGLVVGFEFRDLPDAASENIRAYVATLLARGQDANDLPTEEELIRTSLTG